VSIDSGSAQGMTFNAGTSRWEYVYNAPLGDDSDHTYVLYVYDAEDLSDSSGPYAITVTDVVPPVIEADSYDVGVGTGDSVVLWVSASDNIGVVSADVSIDSGSAQGMTFNAGTSRWEYVYNAPLGDDSDHTYVLYVYDGEGLSDSNGPYTIDVIDDDYPLITNILATPNQQIINENVNITATITDNINLDTIKIDITGPTGFTPINTTMILKDTDHYYYNQTYTIVGIYDYHIWANDTTNNRIQSVSYQFEIYAELQITELITGWNFVSLPFNLTTPKTNLFIMDGGTRYTWSQAVTNDIIYNYLYEWNRTTQGYGDGTITELKSGEGYWIYVYEDCELWATNLTPMVTNDFITHLLTSWNIIGAPLNSQLQKDDLIIQYGANDYTWAEAFANNYVLKDIYGWNRTTSQYIISEVLIPGECYWLFAYVGCTLKQTP
jgi:hypothetical protein